MDTETPHAAPKVEGNCGGLVTTTRARARSFPSRIPGTRPDTECPTPGAGIMKGSKPAPQSVRDSRARLRPDASPLPAARQSRTRIPPRSLRGRHFPSASGSVLPVEGRTVQSPCGAVRTRRDPLGSVNVPRKTDGCAVAMTEAPGRPSPMPLRVRRQRRALPNQVAHRARRYSMASISGGNGAYTSSIRARDSFTPTLSLRKSQRSRPRNRTVSSGSTSTRSPVSNQSDASGCPT